MIQLLRIMTLCSLLIVAGLMYQTNLAKGGDHPELKAFPEADVGMERFVIVLDPREGKEEFLKVEIIPGRVMLADGINLMRLGTTLEPRTLMGWGYTYYEVTGKDVAMSTMMAPPENGQQVKAFVPGTSLLVRYNSRLPLVIYAPATYEIRYRIWQASIETMHAEKR